MYFISFLLIYIQFRLIIKDTKKSENPIKYNTGGNLMNKELFNEASKSNILSKKLVDQLQESMDYSSISFIN